MTKRTKLLLIGLGVLALLAPALPAQACSCFYSDPRDRLAESDAAIIGTLIESHPVDPPVDNSGEDTIYTFTVDEEVKGDFGETVEVHAPYSGASCGIEVGIGQQTGLFLDVRDDGAWASHLCAQIAPEELREAAAPLPAPDGEQPVRVLVGGNWGEVDHLALDADGRTTAYGYGETANGELEVCPNVQLFLQLYQPTFRSRTHQLRVRDLETDEVVREVEVPIGRNHYVVELTCLDPEAEDVLIAATNDGQRPSGRIFRVDGTGATLIYEGRPLDAAFLDSQTALITTGRNMTRLKMLELDSGAKTPVAALPARSYGLVVSPDEKRVAALSGGEGGSILSVSLTRGRVRSTLLPRHGCGQVAWHESEIVYLPGGCSDTTVRVFDARLTDGTPFDGDWYAGDADIVGDFAYGMGWGVLYRADLSAGTAEPLREFPAPELYFLEAVEEAPSIDWPTQP